MVYGRLPYVPMHERGDNAPSAIRVNTPTIGTFIQLKYRNIKLNEYYTLKEIPG